MQDLTTKIKPAVGVILIGVGAGAAVAGTLIMSNGGLLFWIFGLASLAIASLLVGRGRGLLTRPVAEVLTISEGSAILLLRAFVDDGLATRHRGINLGAHESTFEELVVRALEDFGAVVTIGRPGELLPRAGASREWRDEDSWRERVSELILRCQAVVMIMSNGVSENAGLRWEVTQLLSLREPAKIMLVLPQSKTDSYLRSTWNAYSALFEGRLPSYKGGELVATFASNWSCTVTRLVLGDRDVADYKAALAAAAESMGFRRRPLRRDQLWDVFVTVIALSSGLVCAAIAFLVMATATQRTGGLAVIFVSCLFGVLGILLALKIASRIKHV